MIIHPLEEHEANTQSVKRCLPDHVHHQDDVEDNEKVVCVPEDLIVEHPIKNAQGQQHDYLFIFSLFSMF